MDVPWGYSLALERRHDDVEFTRSFSFMTGRKVTHKALIKRKNRGVDGDKALESAELVRQMR